MVSDELSWSYPIDIEFELFTPPYGMQEREANWGGYVEAISESLDRVTIRNIERLEEAEQQTGEAIMNYQENLPEKTK